MSEEKTIMERLSEIEEQIEALKKLMDEAGMKYE